MRGFVRLIYLAGLTSVLAILIAIGCGKDKQSGEVPTGPGIGTIVIVQSPDDLEGAGWTLTGPENHSGSGDTVLSGVQVGEYTITWNEVNGYLKPSPETKVLVAGDTIAFTGNYLQETGTVVIDQTPDELEGAGWELTGPVNTSGSGDSILANMPVGTYTITWNSVSGYYSPSTQTKILAAGDTITFSGVYSIQVGTIIVDQSPDYLEGAGWHITGPLSLAGSGDTTLPSMPVGEYSITWNEVGGYYTPESQIKLVSADQTVTFFGDYVRQTGVVVIDQEPDELEGAGWILAGSENYSGSGDSILNSVPTGEYTITWNKVDGYETPPQETKMLAPNDTIAFAGVYEQGEAWQRTFGGYCDDRGYWVEQTTDGGYIIVGTCTCCGTSGIDVWLIRTDSKGNKIWDKIFTGPSHDYGYCVQQTTDGGFIIAASTNPQGSDKPDFWLIKTNQNGEMEWEKTFGGDGTDYPSQVRQTSDGGYVIVGNTSSFAPGSTAIWVIKTDGKGEKVWDAVFGGIQIEGGFSIQETSDGGYIVAGFTTSYGGVYGDAFLIKLDGDGNKIWEKAIGDYYSDRARSVLQTPDGGYIIAGYKNSSPYHIYDFWVVKTDSDGNNVWEKTFGGAGDDRAYCIDQTSDGGFIIVGGTASFGAGSVDVWLIKTDCNGDQVWSRTFGGAGWDEGYCVHQTQDGGYIIVGENHSFGSGLYDVWLIKTDPNGNLN